MQLIIKPTIEAEWHDLVRQAEAHCAMSLDEELEYYLIVLLMHYVDKPEIAEDVLGLDLLKAHQADLIFQHNALRDVADKCLLYSGFFPQQAERRHVSIAYFVKLGQQTYHSLASFPEKVWRGPYPSLSKGFVSLMDVMHSMYEIDREGSLLSPIQAFQLWQETGSEHAHDVVQQYAEKNSTVVLPASGDDTIN